MGKQFERVAFYADSMTREEAVQCLLPAWRAIPKELKKAFASPGTLASLGEKLFIEPLLRWEAYTGWITELNLDQKENTREAFQYFSERDCSTLASKLKSADKPMESLPATAIKSAECELPKPYAPGLRAALQEHEFELLELTRYASIVKKQENVAEAIVQAVAIGFRAKLTRVSR